jgi:hypothetical protein
VFTVSGGKITPVKEFATREQALTAVSDQHVRVPADANHGTDDLADPIASLC